MYKTLGPHTNTAINDEDLLQVLKKIDDVGGRIGNDRKVYGRLQDWLQWRNKNTPQPLTYEHTKQAAKDLFYGIDSAQISISDRQAEIVIKWAATKWYRENYRAHKPEEEERIIPIIHKRAPFPISKEVATSAATRLVPTSGLDIGDHVADLLFPKSGIKNPITFMKEYVDAQSQAGQRDANQTTQAMKQAMAAYLDIDMTEQQAEQALQQVVSQQLQDSFRQNLHPTRLLGLEFMKAMNSDLYPISAKMMDALIDEHYSDEMLNNLSDVDAQSYPLDLRLKRQQSVMDDDGMEILYARWSEKLRKNDKLAVSSIANQVSRAVSKGTPNTLDTTEAVVDIMAQNQQYITYEQADQMAGWAVAELLTQERQLVLTTGLKPGPQAMIEQEAQNTILANIRPNEPLAAGFQQRFSQQYYPVSADQADAAVNMVFSNQFLMSLDDEQVARLHPELREKRTLAIQESMILERLGSGNARSTELLQEMHQVTDEELRNKPLESLEYLPSALYEKALNIRNQVRHERLAASRRNQGDYTVRLAVKGMIDDVQMPADKDNEVPIAYKDRLEADVIRQQLSEAHLAHREAVWGATDILAGDYAIFTQEDNIEADSESGLQLQNKKPKSILADIGASENLSTGFQQRFSKEYYPISKEQAAEAVNTFFTNEMLINMSDKQANSLHPELVEKRKQAVELAAQEKKQEANESFQEKQKRIKQEARDKSHRRKKHVRNNDMLEFAENQAGIIGDDFHQQQDATAEMIQDAQSKKKTMLIEFKQKQQEIERKREQQAQQSQQNRTNR